MFRKRESAKVIERQGEAIIKMNYRITELQEELKLKNIKIKNKKAVISELIEENIEMYAELKQTRIEKEEIEMRATEFARKLNKIVDVMKEFSEEKNVTKQVAINLYTKIKNVLVKINQEDN